MLEQINLDVTINEIPLVLLFGTDTRRRQFVLEQILTFCPSYVRPVILDAPNHNEITEQQVGLFHGLNARQASVTLKHFLACKYISESAAEYGVICEDNIQMLFGASERFKAYREDNSWDIIFESDIVSSPQFEAEVTEDKWLYACPISGFRGTHGGSRGANFVVIRRDAARRICESFFPCGQVSDHHYNEMIRRLNLRACWTSPSLIHKLKYWGSTVTVDGLDSRNNSQNTSDRINKLLNLCRERVYLEVGVMAGVTFRNVDADLKFGVDPNFLFDPIDTEGERYFRVASDDFFAGLNAIDRFNLIFLDGMHTLDQTVKDLLNSIRFLGYQDSFILIDDILPEDIFSTHKSQGLCYQLRARFDPHNLSRSWRGDVYKVVPFVDKYLPTFDWEILSDPGFENSQMILWPIKRCRGPKLNLGGSEASSISIAEFYEALLEIDFLSTGEFMNRFGR